jgi:hypothetical protein
VRLIVVKIRCERASQNCGSRDANGDPHSLKTQA